MAEAICVSCGGRAVRKCTVFVGGVLCDKDLCAECSHPQRVPGSKIGPYDHVTKEVQEKLTEQALDEYKKSAP